MSWFGETTNGSKGVQIIYRCRELNDPGVIQAFSTRSGGNMALHTGDDRQKVVERRREFLAGFDLQPDDLVAGVQTHGVNVRTITRKEAGAGAFDLETAIPDTDALITREPGVILSIYTADCLPVFFYDRATPAVGLAHAGWRGTLNGIAAKTLQEMIAVFHTDPAECRVAIGPAIGLECFNVTGEVARQFAVIAPETVHFADSIYRVDLSGFNRKLLLDMGVPGEHIIDSGLCTSCLRNDFYSYRAGGQTTERMMGIIALREKRI